MEHKLRKHGRGRVGSLPTAFAAGLAAALAGEAAILAVLALLSRSGSIAEDAMPLFAALGALLGSFLGSFVAGVQAPKLSLPIALGVGAALFVINLAIGTLLPESGGFSFAMPAAYMGGALIAGVLSAVKKGGK